jgi:hypothetical protein
MREKVKREREREGESREKNAMPTACTKKKLIEKAREVSREPSPPHIFVRRGTRSL